MPTKRNPVARAIMEAIEDGAAMFWEAEKDAHYVIRRRTGPKRSRIIHRVWGMFGARRLHGRLINLGVRSIGPETTPPEGVATIANAAGIGEAEPVLGALYQARFADRTETKRYPVCERCHDAGHWPEELPDGEFCNPTRACGKWFCVFCGVWVLTPFWKLRRIETAGIDEG